MIKSAIILTQKIHDLCLRGFWDEANRLLPEQEKQIELIIKWLSNKKKTEINPASIIGLKKLNDLNKNIIVMAELQKSEAVQEIKKIQNANKAVEQYSL